VAASATMFLTVAACSDDPSASPSDPSASPSDPSASPSDRSASSGDSLRLVVLGDSIARPDTCPGCTTYPEQLASAMEKLLHADVEVENLAWPAAKPKAAEVADILDLVRTNTTVSEAVAAADAVVVTVGLNDLAYNRLDDPCDVAPNYPRVDWRGISHACVDAATAEYRRDLDALLGVVEHLRAGKPTMLRVTTVYNSTIGDVLDPTWNSPAAIEPSVYAVTRMAAVQCEIAKDHGGLCADTLHRLNGANGAKSAQPFLLDFVHLAQRGQDAFADALVAVGMAPLRP
jgi:hypothetical protein